MLGDIRGDKVINYALGSRGETGEVPGLSFLLILRGAYCYTRRDKRSGSRLMNVRRWGIQPVACLPARRLILHILSKKSGAKRK